MTCSTTTTVEKILKIFGGEIVVPVIKNNKTMYIPLKKTKKQIKREIESQTLLLFDEL